MAKQRSITNDGSNLVEIIIDEDYFSNPVYEIHFALFCEGDMCRTQDTFVGEKLCRTYELNVKETEQVHQVADGLAKALDMLD